MPPATRGDVTSLLHEASGRDASAWDRLFVLVYDEFRALARNHFRRQPSNHTLQPTAVVHEAYLKLVDQTRVDWKDRNHFFAVGARAMRQILVDHARAKGTDKRGAGARKIPIEERSVYSLGNEEDVLAVDEALGQLAQLDPRQARIVELHFFGGLTNEETTEVLDISERTVRREWRMCSAWLRSRLGGTQ